MRRVCVSFVVLAAFAAGYDPEQDMTAPEIIAHWGYPVQDIAVTTVDGYILHMHRIPFGKSGVVSNQPRPVIFLQHGLLASSSSWITNLPNQAFGFIAADMGFDVWMGNSRGNVYSLGHTSLNYKTDKNYWAFRFFQFLSRIGYSWDEMTAKDLETMIDYVLNATNTTQLYYAGHSQGTLTMFTKLATDADFNQKVEDLELHARFQIKKFFALGPVITVQYIKGLLALFAHNFMGVYQVIGDGPFLVTNAMMHTAIQLLCLGDVNQALCHSVLGLVAGPKSNQMNNSRIPVYLSDEPGGTSNQNMLHYMQMVKSGKTQMFDYGSNQANIQNYGQKTPPLYDVSKITTDVHLFWSDVDWLATKRDINEYLLPSLNPLVVKENIRLEGFNHLDFIWGLRASNEIYIPILNSILADVSGS